MTESTAALRDLINHKATTQGWEPAAEHAMRYLANLGKTFSADDLRDLMGEHRPANPNSIGSLFMSWSRQNLIQRTGFTPSKNTKSNSSVIFQWRGTQAK